MPNLYNDYNLNYTQFLDIEYIKSMSNLKSICLNPCNITTSKNFIKKTVLNFYSDYKLDYTQFHEYIILEVQVKSQKHLL